MAVRNKKLKKVKGGEEEKKRGRKEEKKRERKREIKKRKKDRCVFQRGNTETTASQAFDFRLKF